MLQGQWRVGWLLYRLLYRLLCAHKIHPLCRVAQLRPQLVEEAQRRWQAEEEGVADDITMVVIFFQHTSP